MPGVTANGMDKSASTTGIAPSRFGYPCCQLNPSSAEAGQLCVGTARMRGAFLRAVQTVV
jgi:hypothetical protein